MLAAIEAVVAKTLERKSGDSDKPSGLSDWSRRPRPSSRCVDSSQKQQAPLRGKSSHPVMQSPVAGGSGIKSVYLSSDEEDGFLGVDPASSGFDSDYEDRDGDDTDCLLGVSALAFQGAWTVNRASGKRFLPIFLVSGFRVDWYPDSRTVSVARRRYEVARHLMLPRSTWVADFV